ncbi:hypothetical protein U1Q18_022739 [Sarracenia purpurea var. burkii]
MASPRDQTRAPQLVDQAWLCSLVAETRFENLFTCRTVCIEKDFILTDFDGSPILERFERLRWTQFLHAKGTGKKNDALPYKLFISNYLRSLLDFRIHEHTNVERYIHSINRRTASLSLTHDPIDLSIVNTTTEDAATENVATGAASHTVRPSSSAIQGESSRTPDLPSLHSMRAADIEEYRRDRDEYLRNHDALSAQIASLEELI